MTPEQLAEALAHQARQWAIQAGAAAGTLPLAAEAGRRVAMALAEGHTCLPVHLLASGGAELAATAIVGPAAAPGSHPLVQDVQGRLYLHRYFDYEQRLARRLHAACIPAGDGPPDAAQRALLASWLQRPADAMPGPSSEPLDAASGSPATGSPATGSPVLAAAGQADEIDWQRQAAALALLRRFVLISGGPGTGKTSAVVRLLACLLTLEPDTRVVLAAPTGKAAARMQQALLVQAGGLPEEIRAALPTTATTLHRLLGRGDGVAGFRHHAGAPLPLDVLVIDEASMLDLALATHVFEAVPLGARIILLGDRDQLAAVQSGAVFAELSRSQQFSADTRRALAELTATPQLLAPAAVMTEPTTASSRAGSGLTDAVVWFTRQYRFAADSAISGLAQAVRTGATERALALLGQPSPELTWQPHPPATPDRIWLAGMAMGFDGFLQAVSGRADPAAVFEAFEQFRVLCARRGGPWGTAALNAALASWARDQVQGPSQQAVDSPWFKGRPVLILRNDAVLGLFNGDVGIVLPDGAGELQVCFQQADGSMRWIAPVRLPEHDSAYAMTIHKSQGSEFARVAVLLPAESSPVLTRELLYTGITRARTHVLLQASAERVREAIDRPTERRSGLLDRLSEAAGNAGMG